MVPPARVLPGEGNHRESCKRGALPGDSASRYLDAHGVRRGIEDSVRAHGNRRHPIESLRKGPASAGGARTHAADATNHATSSKEAETSSRRKGEHVLPPVLESRCEMDRDRRPEAGAVRECGQSRGNHLLGQGDQDDPSESLPAVPLRDSDWPGDTRTGSVCGKFETRPAPVLHDGPGDGPQDESTSRSRVWNTFHKKRCNYIPVSRDLPRESQDGGRPEPHETPQRRITVALQRKQYYNGKGSRDAESLSTSPSAVTSEHVAKCFEEVPYLRRHSVVCARRSSRLAKAHDAHLPLHFKKSIPVIHMDQVKEWMSLSAATRFRKVVDELLWVPKAPYPEPSVKGSLPEADVRLLEDAGIMYKVPAHELRKRPSMRFMIPFTVVETDDEGNQRRRFISWTRDDNDRLKSYEPKVPLYHPSKYLHKAHEPMAVKRDFTCGFYQIGIPKRARPKFRLRTNSGDVYEMNVLPMGHRCAPEVMHTVTAAIAGEASICSQRYSFHRGAIDVYVDGVRFAGTNSEATTYSQFIDERCDKANGLFKDRGQPPVAQYVFNGVAFDHNAHTVCLGPRVIRKLRADSFFNISFVDLEAVVGRLIYGSAVLRLKMPRFYFALKVAQRRINLLNRCPKLCDRPVALPVVTRSMLAEWRNELLENVPRSPPPHPDVVPHKHRLYTDASVKGWGAIMYLDSGEVLITGEAWPESSSYEVNRAEAAAVRLALEKFSAHCPRGTCLDVFVDNTSCQAALNRRISKSEGVSMELREVLRLTEEKGICVKAAYISTDENPADAVSRGKEVEKEKVETYRGTIEKYINHNHSGKVDSHFEEKP